MAIPPMIAITKDEREILLHSLGLTRRAESYRNYFNAEPGHSDMPLLLSLIDKGLMFQSSRNPAYFHVSDAGKAMVNCEESND